MIPAASSPETEETRYGAFLDLGLLRRLWRFARPHGGMLALSLALSPLVALLPLAMPLLLQRAVDVHLLPGNLAGFPGLVGGYALLVLAQLAVGHGHGLTNHLLGLRVAEGLRAALFRHLLAQDAAFFTRQPTGRLTDRIANDSEAVGRMIATGLPNVAADLLLMIGIAACMLFLSPRLSLVVLAAMPLWMMAAFRFARGLRDAERRGRLLQSRLAGRITELCEGHEVVRLCRGQAEERRAFDRDDRAFLANALAGNGLEAWQVSLAEGAPVALMAGLLAYGAHLAASEPVSLGVVVAFIEYVRLFFLPVRELANRLAVTQGAMTALERIFELLDTPAAVTCPGGGLTLSPVRGEIVLAGVSFAYEETPVLREVSCRIRPGEKVAVVGPTGAGKSTLLALLNRTHDATAGAVLLDGIDVRAWPLAVLRRGVGVVAQETFLFSGSIADNLALGDAAVTGERIRWAIDRIGAGDFIAGLPDGYGTVLTEGGSNLSSGERQLLGLARAMVCDPPVLVLDEAARFVDAIAERRMRRAMARVTEGRTVVVVAHRLETVLQADRILVLVRGRLVEEGSHGELLARGGVYERLFRLQFRGEEA